MNQRYTKAEAIVAAKNYLKTINKLGMECGLTLNTDSNEVLYISYLQSQGGYKSVAIGWLGDGSGLSVTEKDDEIIKQEALSKLTDEEIEVLGLLK